MRMPKPQIPKLAKPMELGSHESRKRHVGDGGAAKSLARMSNVTRRSATHIKTRMKRFT